MTAPRIPALIACLAAAALSAVSPAAGADPVLEEGEFDPSAWSALVRDYAHETGVDYAAWREAGTAGIDAFLESAAGWDPRSVLGKEPKLAYYLNVYNAAAVRRILSHPPVESVRDIEDYFTGTAVVLRDTEYSLDGIEDEIARYAGSLARPLLCTASGERGRAVLPNRAYTAGAMDEMARVVAFDAGRRSIGFDDEAGAVILPAYLERHRKVLDTVQNGLVGFLSEFLSLGQIMQLDREDPAVRYEPCDGALNARIPGEE